MKIFALICIFLYFGIYSTEAAPTCSSNVGTASITGDEYKSFKAYEAATLENAACVISVGEDAKIYFVHVTAGGGKSTDTSNKVTLTLENFEPTDVSSADDTDAGKALIKGFYITKKTVAKKIKYVKTGTGPAGAEDVEFTLMNGCNGAVQLKADTALDIFMPKKAATADKVATTPTPCTFTLKPVAKSIVYVALEKIEIDSAGGDCNTASLEFKHVGKVNKKKICKPDAAMKILQAGEAGVELTFNLPSGDATLPTTKLFSASNVASGSNGVSEITISKELKSYKNWDKDSAEAPTTNVEIDGLYKIFNIKQVTNLGAIAIKKLTGLGEATFTGLGAGDAAVKFAADPAAGTHYLLVDKSVTTNSIELSYAKGSPQSQIQFDAFQLCDGSIVVGDKFTLNTPVVPGTENAFKKNIPVKIENCKIEFKTDKKSLEIKLAKLSLPMDGDKCKAGDFISIGKKEEDKKCALKQWGAANSVKIVTSPVEFSIGISAPTDKAEFEIEFKSSDTVAPTTKATTKKGNSTANTTKITNRNLASFQIIVILTGILTVFCRMI